MAPETTLPEKTLPEKTPSRSRWVEGSTLGFGTLVILALFVMINYLAIRHYERFDWTSDKIYSLSQKSLAVIEGIDEEIDLVVFLSPDLPVYGPVNELLSNYAAANSKLKKRQVDPAKNLLEAQRLIQRYSIERANVVIVASADDRRVIEDFELVEYDYSGAQMGQPPTIGEFKGEQQITSALLALADARKPKLLFTTGHGEAPLERGSARSLSLVSDLLEGDGFEVDEWGSVGQDEVPADTDLVVIAGPSTNFLPPELEVLSSYFDGGGRLMIMLDPVFAAGTGAMVDLGFTEWLAGYGVEIRDDVVIDPNREMAFYGPETIFTDSYGSHPVVEALAQRRTRVLLPLARSISKSDTDRDGLEVVELVRTSDDGWGETNLEALEQEVAPDDEDVPGPVSLAVAVSLEVAEDEADAGEAPAQGAVEAPGEEAADELEELAGFEDGTSEDEASADAEEARMVVIGDLDLATDSQVEYADNTALLLNAFNWLVEREDLIDIEARKPEQTTLTLSQGELSQVYLLVLLIMPGLAVAFGIWIYLRRRR